MRPVPFEERPRCGRQLCRARGKRHHPAAQLGKDRALGHIGMVLFAGVEKGPRIGQIHVRCPKRQIGGKARGLAIIKTQKQHLARRIGQGRMPRRKPFKPAISGKGRTATPERQHPRLGMGGKAHQRPGIAAQMGGALKARSGEG